MLRRFRVSALLLFLVTSTSWGVDFKKTRVKVGREELTVEVAETEAQREQGLMNRKKLGDKEGMIFVFPNERVLTFWMKNTLIPLSVGYFDSSGKLFQVLDMEPASPIDLSPTLYESRQPAKYALEVSKGWFAKHKVKTGDKLVLNFRK